MTINVLDLEQICDIADRVYFDVINHLDIEHKCIEDDEETGGTKNTEFGSDLYFLIEDAIEKAVDYQRLEGASGFISSENDKISLLSAFNEQQVIEGNPELQTNDLGNTHFNYWLSVRA